MTNRMWKCAGLFFVAVAGAAGGCMHLKGVVVDQNDRPLRTGVVAVGRPGAIRPAELHPVDGRGQFDFTFFMADQSAVYLYDSTNREGTLRRVENSEMGEKMRLQVHPLPIPMKDDMDMKNFKDIK
jgi:hypothetical protein